MRSLSDSDGARIRSRLHSCSNIGGVAEDIGGIDGAFTNYHQTRIDADPRGQLRMPGLFVELGDRVEDREAGARGALGVVVIPLPLAAVPLHTSPHHFPSLT